MTPIKLAFELPGMGDDRQPPAEFRIFPFGKIDTSKGTFTFDSDAARLVLSAWKDQGNQLPMDYDHTQVEGPYPAPAAGWYDLELRSDGLYATNIKWTKRATEHLGAAEYRYFSPAFQTDSKKRITKLINIALTNLPATKNMKPLVAAHLKTTERTMAKHTKITTLDDGESLSKFVSKRCDELDMSTDELSKKMGMKTDELDELTGGAKLSKKHANALSKHLDVGLDSFKPWINDELDETDELDDSDGDGKDGDQGQPKGGKKDPAPPKNTDDTGDVATSLLSLTGRKTHAEALNQIAKWKRSAVENVTLSERLEALENERDEEKLGALIEQGLKSGKLQKSQREWALASGRKDIEILKDYLASAPAGGPAVFRENQTPRKDSVQIVLSNLSELELEMCKDSGMKPADFAATKAQLMADGKLPTLA